TGDPQDPATVSAKRRAKLSSFCVPQRHLAGVGGAQFAPASNDRLAIRRNGNIEDATCFVAEAGEFCSRGDVPGRDKSGIHACFPSLAFISSLNLPPTGRYKPAAFTVECSGICSGIGSIEVP